MVILAVTFLWTHHGAGQGWSWVRQLGTTSLLVYWVHIELVYGAGWILEGKPVGGASAQSPRWLLILMMIGLSYLRTNGRWPTFRLET
jgi:hypothetical protein